MKLPAALAPLRHRLFRLLWGANVVVSFGVWLQNTGAGWLMATLAPNPLVVSLVQTATVLPVFLLALPGGAMADILDRRRFLIVTQVWMLAAALLLAVLTLLGHTNSISLLAFTFALGMGAAMNSPAWSTVLIEAVPRRDLVQAVALNGVGFNIARALGPAAAGFLVLAGGPALAFGLNAVSYVAVIAALLAWRGRPRRSALPREHLLGAMRAGMRFVRHTPMMRAATARSFAFFVPAAAPWAMLPLVVKAQLHLGAGSYGVLLGLMGAGGVTSGLLLPQVRRRLSRGQTVFAASLSTSLGTLLLGLAASQLVAAAAMVLFGLGWVGASVVTQGAAQMAAPAWVRSRALAIYQLAFNGAMVLGSFFWGWLATRIGLSHAMLAAAATGFLCAILGRRLDIDREPDTRREFGTSPLAPEDVAPELAPLLATARHRVLETQPYRVDPADRAAFLAVMAEVRDVRGRTGATGWQLYEDVAHPEGWLELWTMETWHDHLREAARLSENDRAILTRALAFCHGTARATARYLAVAPTRPGGPTAHPGA